MKNFLTPLLALAGSLREMKEIFYVEASLRRYEKSLRYARVWILFVASDKA